MKKYLYTSVAVLILSGMIFGVSSVSAATFERTTPSIPQTATTMPDRTYNDDLIDAMEYHNTAYLLNGYDLDIDNYKYSVADLELAKRQVAAMDECVVAGLGKQFSNPDEVWNKMKDAASRMQKEYTVNALKKIQSPTEGDVAALAALSTTPTSTQTELTDTEFEAQLVNWNIGDAILRDVYANQDEWGTRIPDSPSFSLWEDQKYVYNKQVWDPKYQAINAYYGVDSGRRPSGVSDKKYDYYYYKDVKNAHQAYLAQLTAQTQKPMPIGDLGAAPKVAPQPLPPVAESIVIRTDSKDAFVGVYPEYPAAWKTYMDNKFTSYNTSGEMASLFNINAKSGTISPKASATTALPNRVSHYLALANNLESAQAKKDAFDEAAKALTSRIQISAAETGIPVPKDLDVTKKKDIAAVQKIFTDARDKKLAEALAKIAKDPQAQAQLANPQNATTVDFVALVRAFQKDPSASVLITTMTAKTIDDELRTAATNKNAMATVHDSEKQSNVQNYQEAMEQINSTCLNGGIKGSFDLSQYLQ